MYTLLEIGPWLAVAVTILMVFAAVVLLPEWKRNLEKDDEEG